MDHIASEIFHYTDQNFQFFTDITLSGLYL